MRRHVIDVALVAGLVVALQVAVWNGEMAGSRLVNAVVLTLLVPLPLLFRRRFPFPVLVLVTLGIAGHAVVTREAAEGFMFFAPGLVAMYSVAAYAELSTALAGLGVTVVGYSLHTAFDPAIETGEQVWAFAFFALFDVSAWIVGRYVRSRREARELTARAHRLEEERARAIQDERARIARELHDIVSHNVSVMVVQAEAAEEVLARTPERADESLRRIQRSGREALGEMRRLLGVLRETETEAARAPQPGLDSLPVLVDGVRHAGLRVDLRVEGVARPVPPGVGLAAYRVVQEALTNALKHAGEGRAAVTVRYGDDLIELEVIDDGTGAPGEGGGHGLAGMRERVELYGGRLEAAPRAEGGFRVHATLPL